MLDLDRVLTLVCSIQAMSDFAYQIHYESKGKRFYPIHLLSERVGDTEEVADFKDEIFETVWMGRGHEVPTPAEVQARVMELTPQATDDIQENLKMLRELVINSLLYIEELQDLTMGEGDLFGRIASWLQRNNGLLWNQIEYEE